MNTTESIILLVLCLFIGGCLELNRTGIPGISKDVPKAKDKSGDKTLYRSVVPGMPIGQYRIGGVYVGVAVDQSIVERIQSFLLVVAGVLFIAFLVGLAMLYFQMPIGADIAVLGGSFSLLTAVTAVWAKFIMYTMGIGIAVTGIYWLFVLWRKHQDEKLQTTLVKGFDEPTKVDDLELNWVHRRKVRKLKDR